MIINIIILIAGLTMILAGAEILVEGSSSLAKRARISDFIIGFIIVGIGTSAPEMVVSFIGAIKGNADISVGNIIGSNIFNTLLVLGVTSLIFPITISRQNLRRDIPVNLFVTVLLILLGMNKSIFGLGNNLLSRTDGILLLLIFIVYIFYSVKQARKVESAPASESKDRTFKLSLFMILAGLGALIFGGKIFVDSAIKLAEMWKVSDKFIAITIISMGTSLPELATCIVAATKKKDQLALGNILGSNVFNILLILGGSAIIHPLSFCDIHYMDAGVLLASAIAIMASALTFKKNKLDRADAVVFLIIEGFYLAWLTATV
ncbi:MAG: calcium/sodium antiporter [Bacteroidales bacterium]|jgi:cation:H+ antiporter|nr:calcium/sodium antiporter [Bacteroidales bacterium]